ncbi:MAG: acetolactate synthase small subunit [Phycisphaeraceae bacterium]|nr:acetolactate synthase small subunit [Phycisphaeraceae bacterium]
MSPMQAQATSVMRHVIAALVTNEPGVLAQVAGMFAARGFNIDSLVVGRTENPELSRMTIVVIGDAAVLEQVRKQLQKLVPVVKVVDYQDVAFVERDLVIVQVNTRDGDNPTAHRTAVIQVAQIFRANIVDLSPDRMMLELGGAEEKLEAFVEQVKPFGLIELARTGVIAMPRGNSDGTRRAIRSGLVRIADMPQHDDDALDPGDLPPG